MNTPEDLQAKRSARGVKVQSEFDDGAKQSEKSKMSEKMVESVQKAKQAGKEQLETQKDRAAEQVQQLAGSIERASDTLSEEQPSLAAYAGQIASSLNDFSDNLRTRTFAELLDETQALARRNPTLFLLGSVGVGLALARFLKASPRRGTWQQPGSETDSGVRTNWAGESQDYIPTETDLAAQSEELTADSCTVGQYTSGPEIEISGSPSTAGRDRVEGV